MANHDEAYIPLPPGHKSMSLPTMPTSVLADALDVLNLLVSTDPCVTDAEGNCTRHGWYTFGRSECAHARARRLLNDHVQVWLDTDSPEVRRTCTSDNPHHHEAVERGIHCLIRNHRYQIEKARQLIADRAGVHVWSHLADPASAPLGTTVVFPAQQDEHHPRQIAVRWSPPWNLDEELPWLILGSNAGIQKLSNDVVQGCEVLTIPLADACASTIPDDDA